MSLTAEIKKSLPSVDFTEKESSPGDAELTVSKENIIELLSCLKNNLGFNHLADLTAYDDAASSKNIFVVYELINMNTKKRCRVQSPLDPQDLKVESVCKLWSGANWLEREVFDMYGVIFNKHKDLRRLLLPPTFKGHPLRKDFVMDYRQDFSSDPQGEEVFDPFGHSVVSEKELGDI